MDVLLEKVAEGLKALATCYLKMSSSTQQMCWPLYMERLLLLQCRSKDVLLDFSGYYCLRLLLDNESALATFFIDLFHELEWLLETMLTRGRNSSSPELYDKICELLGSIKPAAESCRYLFAITQLSSTACSHEWLSTGKDQMKREGKVYRDFSMDDFHCLTKMLPFVNLDQCSNYNKVKLGKKLGSGGYASVYEGHFVTWNDGSQSLRMAGEPVAVKVFRYYGDCATEGESAGSSRSIGSQFFDQMEKIVELQKMKTNGDTTSSMSAREREIWTIVSAKHPNIVTARGYIGERPPHGESGLVMELMDTSLQEHLEKVEGPLEELEMIDLMLEIAKGMRFLHECELVHKDLKPGNILLRSQKKPGRCENYRGSAMEVKLADFGLTQYFVQDVDPTPAGTYCYMAPEVLHMSADYEASYQDKVDVFSYGTICFNILTCEVPGALEFTCASSKASSAEFYEAVKSSAWREGVEGKPEYLIDLIARCWDFDPSRRPTFATICSLLQRAMLCILSPPVINVTRLSSFQHHNLKDLYQRIVQSSRDHCVNIGTRTIKSCVEEFSRDVEERGHMRSKLSEDATLFLEEWSKMRGSSSNAARTEEEDVGDSSAKQLAAEETALSVKQSEAASGRELFEAIVRSLTDGSISFTTPVVRPEEFSRDVKERGHMLSEDATLFADPWDKMRGRTEEDVCASSAKQLDAEETVSVKQSEAAASGEELFDAIDEANDAGAGSPVVRVVEVQKHSWRIPRGFVSKSFWIRRGFLSKPWRIPLKTMDPEWIVFKALVCDSMFHRFLDGRFWQAASASFSDVEVDESLIPFLVCFWEGFIGSSTNKGASIFRWYADGVEVISPAASDQLHT